MSWGAEYDGDRFPAFPTFVSSPDTLKVFDLSFPTHGSNSDPHPPPETFICPSFPFYHRDPESLMRENEMLRTHEQTVRLRRNERLAENMRLKTQLNECRATFRAVLLGNGNPMLNGNDPQ
jgi:hypothetical protein